MAFTVSWRSYIFSFQDSIPATCVCTSNDLITPSITKTKRVRIRLPTFSYWHYSNVNQLIYFIYVSSVNFVFIKSISTFVESNNIIITRTYIEMKWHGGWHKVWTRVFGRLFVWGHYGHCWPKVWKVKWEHVATILSKGL